MPVNNAVETALTSAGVPSKTVDKAGDWIDNTQGKGSKWHRIASAGSSSAELAAQFADEFGLPQSEVQSNVAEPWQSKIGNMDASDFDEAINQLAAALYAVNIYVNAGGGSVSVDQMNNIMEAAA